VLECDTGRLAAKMAPIERCDEVKHVMDKKYRSFETKLSKDKQRQ
jgi:hypothetical protein